MADEGVSVTLKAGRDYDAPWIVIHRSTLDEVKQDLVALDENDCELLHLVKGAGEFFSKMKTTAPVLKPVSTDQAVSEEVSTRMAVQNVMATMPGSEVAASNDPSVKEQELPASLQGTPCKECGKTARLREGYSQKKGRHYAGYFCTADSNHRPTNFRWV